MDVNGQGRGASTNPMSSGQMVQRCPRKHVSTEACSQQRRDRPVSQRSRMARPRHAWDHNLTLFCCCLSFSDQRCTAFAPAGCIRFFALLQTSRLALPTFSQHEAMMWEHCRHRHRRVGCDWRGRSSCEEVRQRALLRLQLQGAGCGHVRAVDTGSARALVHVHRVHTREC